MWTELGILCATVLAYLWLSRPRRPPNFPPGPPTFLVFGNMIELAKASSRHFLQVCEDLRHRFNADIVGLIDPTGKALVHVFSADLIREASSRAEFSGRPDLFPVLYLSFMQKVGVLFSEGAHWQEHRRFSLKHLRDLGLGKSSLSAVIANEYSHLSEHLKMLVGREIKANNMFITTALNIIWKMVADKRFDLDDPKRLQLQAIVQGFVDISGPQNPMVGFPWLRFIIPETSGFNALRRFRTEMGDMFGCVIREHQETLDPDHPRDFVDAFLIEMRKPDAAKRGYTEVNLMSIGMDFFIAGSETTSTAMTWAMLLMCLHPDVQTKVQHELDAVLGGQRYPRYDDRSQLPYVEAVLAEIMRFTSFVSLAVPHCTSSGPAQLAGYTIPQGSIVFMHLHAAHKDKAHWGDPDVFRPERFLADDGSFRRDDNFMPFGVGKRACLGESLARMEFMVFFGCLFQQFRLRLPVGASPPSMDGPLSLFLQPDEYSVVLELRDQQCGA